MYAYECLRVCDTARQRQRERDLSSEKGICSAK